MFFIIREVAGWILVVSGLMLVRMALGFVDNRQVVEAGVIIGAAFIVFRGGIHLVKVSTAARIALGASKPNNQQSEPG